MEKFTDVVRDDDPTNNVPDSIFSKLGMQLHRRDKHPLGIIKNAIYDYFDSNYSNKFEKFEDLSPIVTTKQVSSPYSKFVFFLCGYITSFFYVTFLFSCFYFGTRTLMMC